MNSRWAEWHREYDDPSSSLARRLAVVRTEVGCVLREHRIDRLVSICAGDGRDVLPVLAEAGREVAAVLVELDPDLAAKARATAAELGLDHVDVRTADAGITDSYTGAGPAQLVLACGVFGNVSLADAATTIEALPSLLDRGGIVIWTRGRADNPTGEPGSAPDSEPSEEIRRLFAAAGFSEVGFIRPDDARFRVGVHRLRVPPSAELPANRRLFTFV